MANLNVRLSASLRDDLGVSASTTAYATVPEAATLTQLQTSWNAWAAALDGITDVAVTGGQITVLQPFVGADKGAGVGKAKAGSRVEQTGIINFTSAGNSHRWGEAIPGLANGVISGGKLNLANAAITTFTGILLGGVAGGTFTNPTSQVLIGVKDALLSFREHRRQLQRSSFETA